MNIVKWDPFKTMLDWNDRVAPVAFEGIERAWAPVVDVYAKGDDIVVHAELPGVEKDDIEIHVENGTLTINGERKRASEIEEGKVYRLERAYGSFTRRFSLPKGLDASGVKASFKDGVLEVTLPKAEEAKPRKIEVEAA